MPLDTKLSYELLTKLEATREHTRTGGAGSLVGSQHRGLIRTLSNDFRNIPDDVVAEFKSIIALHVREFLGKGLADDFKIAARDGGFIIFGEYTEDKLPLFFGDITEVTKQEFNAKANAIINLDMFVQSMLSRKEIPGDIEFYGILPNGLSFVAYGAGRGELGNKYSLHYSNGRSEQTTDEDKAGLWFCFRTSYGFVEMNSLDDHATLDKQTRFPISRMPESAKALRAA